jgi:outer membrane immunogenic protein
MSKALQRTALAASLLLAGSATVSAQSAPSWTGFYGGINGAYAWSNVSGTTPWQGNNVDIGESQLTGGAVGGQLGYDLQANDFVLGARVAMNYANASGRNQFNGGSSPDNYIEYTLRDYGSLVARVGYLPRSDTLAYVTGGLAWSRTDHLDSDPAPVGPWVPYSGSTGLNRTGWTLGAGVEQRLTRNVSAFLEFDYSDFGSKDASITTSDGWVTDYTFKQKLNVLSVGLNYRF